MANRTATAEQITLASLAQHQVDSRDGYALALVEVGEGLLRQGGLQRTFATGEAFLIPPDCRAVFTAQYYESIRLAILCAGEERIQASLPDGQAKRLVGAMLARTRSLRQIELPRESFAGLAAGLGWLAAELQNPRAYTGRIVDGLLAGLLLTLAREDGLAPAGQPGAAALGPAETAKQLVRLRYAEPLTLAGTAAALGVSAPYLSALFKAKTGAGFAAYLNQTRLEKAKTLLLDSDELVTQIAEECGFGSSAHFGYAFKKYTGTSPLKYRKQNR